MRLLLDTHALIWALIEPRRLGSNARQALETRANEVLVSPISAMEIATKVRRDRWPEAAPIVHRLETSIAQLGARVIPFTHDHGLWAGSLDWPHRDPFDRMLAAQAALEEATLITVDRAFKTLPAVTTIW